MRVLVLGSILAILTTSPLGHRVHATASQSLVLHNTRWDQVQVEVRTGTSTTCDNNTNGAAESLARGRSWQIVTAEVICWRREQSPGVAWSGWTSWNTAQLGPTEMRDVTL